MKAHITAAGADMLNFPEFVQERNTALLSLDKEKILAYCRKMEWIFPEMEEPSGRRCTRPGWVSQGSRRPKSKYPGNGSMSMDLRRCFKRRMKLC